MKYHFKVHKEKIGYWAECCELDGCISEGDTLEELYLNCEEALNLYLDEPNDSKMVFPLPDENVNENKKKIIKITVEPEIALAVLLRNFRINANMTQKQIAEMLGMKNTYSYQRLELGSNTTLSILSKIHSKFPEIQFEYLFQ